MKNAVVVGVMAAAVLMVGCTKKSSSSSVAPPPDSKPVALSGGSNAWNLGAVTMNGTNVPDTSFTVSPHWDMVKEAAECDKAYFESSPEVAISLNENLVQKIESLHASTKEDEYSDELNLFVAKARLGKLYQQVQDERKSDDNFHAAITTYNKLMSDMSVKLIISNKSEVLNTLQKIDAKTNPTNRL
jgi:hypothetical protein